MITLAFEQSVLELSDRLIWTDEFGWSPTVSANRWGTTGALIIHVGKRQAGRPITLEGSETNAWISRDVCSQLYAWAAMPGAVFELTVRGVARAVRFNHEQSPAFSARPIWRLLDGEHNAETVYVPAFKFIEV